MSAFDPDKTRERLLHDAINLDWKLELGRAHAADPEINTFLWHSLLNVVGVAHIVGLAADPRCQELLRLVLECLERWATQPHNDTDEAHDHREAGAWQTLAIARWMLTSEPQPDLFGNAHEAYRRHFSGFFAKKRRWTAPSIDPWVGLACAAGRFSEVLGFFQQPQLVSYASADVARVRTVTDLGLAIARHRVAASVSQESLLAAGDRMLRHQIVGCLELGGGVDIGFFLYLVQVVIRGAEARPAREAFLSVPDHVSYLVKAKANSARPARPAPVRPPITLPPRNPAPLPPIVHGTTGPEASAEVWDKKPRWTQVDTPQGPRWAVRHEASLLPHDRDPRIPLLHEISRRYLGAEVVSGLRYLARATLDGRVLSELALLPTLCPVEVSFPSAVDNWFDGMIQVSPPMRSRKEWKPALAVGSLARLRAISFDACEEDKARVARGTKPYLIGPEWFWESPLAQQLEALDVRADVHPLAQWIPRFASSSRLSRVLIRMWVPVEGSNRSSCLRLVLDRDGERLRILAQCVSPLHLLASTIAALFAGSSPDQFSTLDFELLYNYPLEEDRITRLLTPFIHVGALRTGGRLIEL